MNGALLKIRSELENSVGKKVAFRANRGRRKSYMNEGVLEDTYDIVFTIMVQEGTRLQRHCYTYGDILTKNVVLKVLPS